ncbi:MAG: hypothetical protein L6V88_03760 [Anaerotruncus sp.]|nr:MAG: hypothetical protein L6V88_03760 [Anaerotruncus sp.]
MKVVFMGTPDFAVPCLQKLIDNKYDIAAVFTQPDKKTGRKTAAYSAAGQGFGAGKTTFRFISLLH